MQVFRELVRYATLASNSQNTPCWKFQIGQDFITVIPIWDIEDPSADDHHLFVFLGCTIESLAIAAKAHGFVPNIDAKHPQRGIQVKLQTEQSEQQLNPTNDSLFEAISVSDCIRGIYNSS
jgi:hypothetical protein